MAQTIATSNNVEIPLKCPQCGDSYGIIIDNIDGFAGEEPAVLQCFCEACENSFEVEDYAEWS